MSKSDCGKLASAIVSSISCGVEGLLWLKSFVSYGGVRCGVRDGVPRSGFWPRAILQLGAFFCVCMLC